MTPDASLNTDGLLSLFTSWAYIGEWKQSTTYS